MSRPVLTPDAYTGEGSWDDWLDHFESVAKVNKWDNAAKLLWLRVRMTGVVGKSVRRILCPGGTLS